MSHSIPFLTALWAHVAATPETIALEEGAHQVTYGQLWELGVVSAQGLERLGVARGSRVGLEWPRGVAWVVGMLGCWMHGCAWVPLPPDLPGKRRDFIVQKASLRAILGPKGPRRLAERGQSATCSEAYTLFTSGSQGAPKGVVVSHWGLVGMLQGQVEAFGLRPGARGMWGLYPGFDASVSDVGVGLMGGATVVVAPEEVMGGNPLELLHWMGDQGITHADLPPALLRLMPASAAPPSLACVVVGGEVCAGETMRAWGEVVRLMNVYGPTEATVCTSLVQVDPERWDAPYIGSRLPGVRYRLEPWEGGEGVHTLWIGGEQVATGYLDESLTAARFVRDAEGERWFETRDLVRVGQGQAPGLEALDRLVFVGRQDRQFKVGGKLVAPEEVEAALMTKPGVEATRVEVRGGRLVAWVGGKGLKTEALRAHIRELLPAYMVPSVWECNASLERNAAGKVQSPGPTTAAQRMWQQLWQQVFGMPVGVHDTFGSCGGSSLDAMELLMLAGAMGLETDLAFDEHTTIQSLCEPTEDRRHQEAALWRQRAEGMMVASATKSSQKSQGDRWFLTGRNGVSGLSAGALPAPALARAEGGTACAWATGSGARG